LEFIDKDYRFFIIFNPFLFGPQDFDICFGFLGIVPKVGSEGFLLVVGYFNKFFIDVKDTSSTHQGAPQYLLFVR
jgi:hypothetical protein